MSMVQADTASRFWAAVEDCLVTFHDFERNVAAEKVTGLWRRLPSGSASEYADPSFADMIYHAEPWYIACNLAEHELPLQPFQGPYQEVLKANDLV